MARFGLPLLQQKSSPLRATLPLGLVWGVWHVPLYGPAGFVIPMVLALFYTVLWNRTHSLGLCILLHASFTPAQDQLILMARDQAYTDVLDTPDWVILGVYMVAVRCCSSRSGEAASGSRQHPPEKRPDCVRVDEVHQRVPKFQASDRIGPERIRHRSITGRRASFTRRGSPESMLERVSHTATTR